MIDVRGLPYFAYGSNLSVQDMEARCPEATRIGRARLDGWRLTFRGVADIEVYDGGSVEGAVWDVTDRCVKSLDRYEGAPQLYDREVVYVEVPGRGTVKAFTYVMTSHLEVGLPSPYYYRVIVRGYGNFDIPEVTLREALLAVQEKHEDKGVSHYEPVGEKRLMAVLEEELEEELLDELAADDDFFAGMSPATRSLYELEMRTDAAKGRHLDRRLAASEVQRTWWQS